MTTENVTSTQLTSSYWPADTSEPILDSSIGGMLRTVAGEVPDRTALVSVSPDEPTRTWTYAQLLDDAVHAAHWLLERFAPGDHITVWSPNLPEWVILQYGAALAGVGLVTANPSLRGAELKYVLEQSESVGIAFADEFRGTDMRALLADVLPETPTVREHVAFTGWLDTIRALDTAGRALPHVSPNALVQLQYTSGTTGYPKAARLSHRAMLTNASYVARRALSSPGGTWVSALPLFHTAGSGTGVLGALTERSTLVLCVVFDAELVLRSIRDWRADQCLGVPAMLRAILDHPRFGDYDLSTLQVVRSGGDTVPPELVNECESRFAVRFTTVYGQTELSPIVAQTSPDDSTGDKCSTVGRPLWNVEVSIRDADGAIVPIGDVGEICARGYQTMLGYHNMPDQTRDTVDPDGWLHTGDLGSMDERGYVRVTGRLKDMIIRGGENIYPREVEGVLNQHPAVSAATVIGIPDRQWGESVAAIVILDDAHPEVTATELHAFVRVHLAPHKTPKAWYRAGELPTNAMGKLQKFRVREQIVAGELVPLADTTSSRPEVDAG